VDCECFYLCSSLRDVTFEVDSQATEIGERAFNGCSSLQSIRIPSRVEVLKRSSFGNCPNLIEFLIERGSKLDEIEDSVFETWDRTGPGMQRPSVIFTDQVFSAQVDFAVQTRWRNLSSWRAGDLGSILVNDESFEGYNHCFPA
jgi:hypothetical protein